MVFSKQSVLLLYQSGWHLYLEVDLTKAFLVVQMVKNPPAMRETWVQSLGWEDPLEEGMATHSSVLDWRMLMDKGAWRAAVHGITQNWTRLKRLSTAEHYSLNMSPETVVPNLYGTKCRFHGRQFFHGPGAEWEDGNASDG